MEFEPAARAGRWWRTNPGTAPGTPLGWQGGWGTWISRPEFKL